MVDVAHPGAKRNLAGQDQDRAIGMISRRLIGKKQQDAGQEQQADQHRRHAAKSPAQSQSQSFPGYCQRMEMEDQIGYGPPGFQHKQ